MRVKILWIGSPYLQHAKGSLFDMNGFSWVLTAIIRLETDLSLCATRRKFPMPFRNEDTTNTTYVSCENANWYLFDSRLQVGCFPLAPGKYRIRTYRGVNSPLPVRSVQNAIKPISTCVLFNSYKKMTHNARKSIGGRSTDAYRQKHMIAGAILVITSYPEGS